MKAINYFDAQTNVPTELRTREMELLPTSVKERAHWSAGVTNAEVLQLMDDVRRKELTGEYSRQESMKALRMGLKAMGYKPEPGTEGTIKDLLSSRRQGVYLETNLAMAAGWKNWSKQQAALKFYPAVRLVRLVEKKDYRDWVSRWNEARAATREEGAEMALKTWGMRPGEKGPMCLLNHPLLLELSRFKLPYDPLDYGTGIRMQVVSWKEAEDAGIIEDGVEDMLMPQVRSINDALQMKPDVRDDKLRTQLDKHLKGFGQWQGETLIFTDPNGLRPLAPKDVPATVSAPLPAGFESLQLDAVKTYVSATGKILRTPWTNVARDFSRLLHRVEPTEFPEALTGIIPLSPVESASWTQMIRSRQLTLPVPLQLSTGTVAPAGVRVVVIEAQDVKDLGYMWHTYRLDMKFLMAGERFEFVEELADGTIVLRHLATAG